MMVQDSPGGVLVIVVLPGEIDFASQDRVFEQLDAGVAYGAAVVIADLTATTFCDVAAMRHLVSVRRRAAACGAELRLVIPPGGLVHRLAMLMQAEEMPPAYPSLGEAVAARLVPQLNTLVSPSPRRAAGRIAMAADIIDMIEMDHLHIRRWQGRLSEQLLHLGDPVPRLELAAIWETTASLIGLHMRADDEICGPAVYGRALARETADDHGDISEIIDEARMQPPGSLTWWQLTTAVLSAWSRHRHREQYGPPGERRRHADPELRITLARQWRSFREACIRDQSYPDAPSQVPTCRLRLAHPAVPRLADPAFSPMGCTCQACTETLNRAFGAYDSAISPQVT